MFIVGGIIPGGGIETDGNTGGSIPKNRTN
jgi:hypothetical protein